jgi:hypothetical protein
MPGFPYVEKGTTTVLSDLIQSVSALGRCLVATAAWAANWLSSRLRALWQAHLRLSKVEPAYVAAVGTVAAAILGHASTEELLVAAAVAAVALFTGGTTRPSAGNRPLLHGETSASKAFARSVPSPFQTDTAGDWWHI